MRGCSDRELAACDVDGEADQERRSEGVVRASQAKAKTRIQIRIVPIPTQTANARIITCGVGRRLHA